MSVAHFSEKANPRLLVDLVVGPLACAWRSRELLMRLIRRDVEARFRGSVLGTFWSGAAPLVKLGAYTLVFGLLIQPRWQDQVRDPLLIAFNYFAGLILFDFFMECVTGASNLMRENHIFIKKVMFPVEILPWVVLGHATFRVCIGMALLLVSYVGLEARMPPSEIVLMPLFFVPLALIVLGLMWIVAALATYVRDVAHAVTAFLPILMFISPVFFPLAAVPAPLRQLLLINPLTFPLEQTRMVLFGNGFHAWSGLAAYALVAIGVAALGYRFFIRLRPGFADVL